LATWRSQSCTMPEISEALRPMVAGARYFSTITCMVSTVSPPHQAPPGTTPSPNPVDPSDSFTCTRKLGGSLAVKVAKPFGRIRGTSKIRVSIASIMGADLCISVLSQLKPRFPRVAAVTICGNEAVGVYLADRFTLPCPARMGKQPCWIHLPVAVGPEPAQASP